MSSTTQTDAPTRHRDGQDTTVLQSVQRAVPRWGPEKSRSRSVTTHDETGLTVETYRTITDLNANQWNNVVNQSTLGSVFQRYEWLEAIETGLGYTPHHIVVSLNDNPVAVFPNFVKPLDVPVVHRVAELLPLAQLVSLDPGYGGPVINSEEEVSLALLFEELERHYDPSVVFHFLRMDDPGYLRYGKFLAKQGYTPNLDNCRFVLDLDQGWDQILANMDKTRRRTVRKAAKLDAEVRVVEATPAEVRATYDQYVQNMTRIGGRVYPYVFFDATLTGMGDVTKIFVAEVDGSEVGRYVYFVDEKTSTMHHYFPAIGDSSDFERYPSELLHSHAIQWGIENGYERYDFGGTGSSFTKGTFKQKEKFGGRVVPTIQWEKGYAPVRWNLYRLGRYAYRRSSSDENSENQS